MGIAGNNVAKVLAPFWSFTNKLYSPVHWEDYSWLSECYAAFLYDLKNVHLYYLRQSFQYTEVQISLVIVKSQNNKTSKGREKKCFGRKLPFYMYIRKMLLSYINVHVPLIISPDYMSSLAILNADTDAPEALS